MFAPVTRLPLIAHLVGTGLAFGAFQAVKARLDASYAASGHPVDYATGQLAFDAAKIEGYYAPMAQAGTLDIYRQTQMIDFAFIACMMLLSVLAGTLAARLGGRINRPGRWGWMLGLAAAGLGFAGASFDVVENLLSFVMLSQPAQISPLVAKLYSGAAAAKFALLTGAMLALLLSVLVGMAARAAAAKAGARAQQRR